MKEFSEWLESHLSAFVLGASIFHGVNFAEGIIPEEEELEDLMRTSEKIPASEIAKRSWSEGIWMYLFHDSDLDRGKKHVLVVLAHDRTHPTFEAMQSAFSDVEHELDELHNLKIYFEDHPGGYLHEKFDIPPQEFQWFLIDIHGNVLEHSSRLISVLDVLNRLKGPKLAEMPEERFEPSH